MMTRIILLFLSILFGVEANAQENLKLLQFSEVVNVDSSISKEKLFSKAKEFINIFKGGEAPVIEQDFWKAKGYPVYYRNGMKITGKYQFTVEVKDGKYKYFVTSFYETDGVGFVFDSYCANKEEECILAREAATTEANTYIQILKVGMNKVSMDDW